MTPRLEHVSVSLRPRARELPERCIDHGVAWCSPLVGVAVSPAGVVPPRAAAGGGVPANAWVDENGDAWVDENGSYWTDS